MSNIDPENLKDLELKIVNIARQANGETQMGPGNFIDDGNGIHTPANWCEAFAETAAAMATGIRIRFPSAENHYQSLLAAGNIHTDDNPPEGVYVFYHWAGDAFGHITISNGDGTTIGTCITPDEILTLPVHHYTGYAGWAVPEVVLRAAENMQPADPTGGGLGRRNGNYRSFSWLLDDRGYPMVIGNAMLDEWELGGSPTQGVITFGYPLTQEETVTNDKGASLTVQYFERARLEFHPENQDPYRVLMGRLGAELLDHWIATDHPDLERAKINPTTDAIDSRFVDYWQKNGALTHIGLPLTGVVTLPGSSFQSQIFERAILEDHPGEGWPVQGRLIGKEVYDLNLPVSG